MDQAYLPDRAGPASKSPTRSATEGGGCSEDALTLQAGPGNAEIQDLLTDHGWFDTVNDREAQRALDGLLALPPEAQGAAVDALDDEALENLIDGLPEDRQAELMALASASGDTQRKLQLWSVAHLAEARAAMASDEESPWFFDHSPEAELARHHEDVAEATLSDSEAEIDDEVRHVEARIEAGEAVPPEEIDGLMARKALELDIEQRYGVNLTNTRGATGVLAFLRDESLREFGRRVWSADELREVDEALSRIPAEHVRDNPAVQEIRRMEGPTTGLQVSHGLIGSTMEGRVSIYDEAAVVHAPTSVPAEEDSCPPVNPMRTERTSGLAHHAAGVTGANGELSQMQDAITHELGHAVQMAHPEAAAALTEAAGWRRIDDTEAMRDWVEEVSGERPADGAFDKLEADRADPSANHDPVQSGDWTYGYDPYNPNGYVVYASDAIPKDDQAEAMVAAERAGEIDESCPVGADDWAYARTSPEEHFAELYTKAIHQPEALRLDLVDEPAARVAEAARAVEEAQGWLSSATGTPEEIVMQRATLQSRQASLQRAQAAQTARAEQWTMLRGLLPALPP